MSKTNRPRRARHSWFGWAGSPVSRRCEEELALIAERRRAASDPATLGLGPVGR